MIALLKTILERTPYRIVNCTQRRGLSLAADVHDLFNGIASPLILDIGANEGQTATHFRAQFPQAIIHSFEPIGGTFEKLREHLKGDSKTQCHQFAFGPATTQTTIYPQTNSQFNSLVPAVNTSVGKTGEAVRVTTVDTFCLETGIESIDLLKTDTEGYDLEVLRGATQLLGKKRIHLILSEAGIRSGDVRHTPLAQLLTFLQSFGYRLFGLYDLPHKNASMEAEFCNALFVAESSL